MKNGIMKLSKTAWVRAIAITIVVAVGSYILKVGDIWALDWHLLTNNAVMAGIASLLLSLGTTNEGKLLGGPKVE